MPTSFTQASLLKHPVIQLSNYTDFLLKRLLHYCTLLAFLLQLMFYSRQTIIYVLLFLPSVVSFYKKTFISLSNITKPSLKNILLIIVGCLSSFKLKIIPNYCSRCVSIRFLEQIDSYMLRLVSLSESKYSKRFLSDMKIMPKKSVPMETEGLSDTKIGTER